MGKRTVQVSLVVLKNLLQTGTGHDYTVDQGLGPWAHITAAQLVTRVGSDLLELTIDDPDLPDGATGILTPYPVLPITFVAGVPATPKPRYPHLPLCPWPWSECCCDRLEAS